MLHHLSELLSFISEYSSTYSTCNTSVYWTGAIVTLSFLITVKHNYTVFGRVTYTPSSIKFSVTVGSSSVRHLRLIIFHTYISMYMNGMSLLCQ